MSGRLTPLALSLLSLAAWTLTLAVFTARGELLIAVVPIAIVIMLGSLRRRPDYAVEHRLSARRVFEGETITVTITLTARAGTPMVEVLDVLPRDCEVVSGRSRALVSLRKGRSAEVRYELRARRGAHDLGTTVLRARDRWAVRGWERRHADRKTLHVYPRALAPRNVPRPLRTQTSIGNYVATALGEGIEPGGIRPFAPGDRLREINWRASLRLDTLHVTQRHRERNADVVLMLDTLSEVGPPEETTLDLGVRATASLAAAYLARKDRVGLIVYGGTIDWVKPAAGAVQYERLAEVLLRAGVVFTYVSKDLALVPPRVLPAQALVIAVTALLDQRFTRAVTDLAGRGFDVVVLVVSAVDVTRRVLIGSELDDAACRLWALERRAVVAELERHAIRVLQWRPDEPLELALAAQPRRRPRRVVLG